MSSTMMAACCRFTTSCIWCRSANICRSRTDGKTRLRAAHESSGWIHSRHAPPLDGNTGRAPRAAVDLLRSDFPGNISARDDRPGWIVNLTNDGWFGISTGPYQHLQQARLRAIEEGLPVVRAANTGISAVIDPEGRIVARLDLGIEGVLDGSLPAAIPPTVYARTGDIPAATIVVAALLLVIRRRISRRNS
jgi:Apolipoprotein N-acyltransferase